MKPTEYTIGSKAFLDSFAGLVPCKTLDLYTDGDVKLQVTRDHGAYRKGEILSSGQRYVIPPKQLRKTQYSYRIKTYFVWVKGSV